MPATVTNIYYLTSIQIAPRWADLQPTTTHRMGNINFRVSNLNNTDLAHINGYISIINTTLSQYSKYDLTLGQSIICKSNP